MSGSCEIETCSTHTPTVTEIGELLYGYYENATRLTTNFKNLLDNSILNLYYYHHSFDYCHPQFIFDYKGTKGRECYSESICSTMCCNNGDYDFHNIKEKYECHCRFSWLTVNVICE
ncbi:unnamed protein product, partial [Didymodactylos carnosus]